MIPESSISQYYSLKGLAILRGEMRLAYYPRWFKEWKRQLIPASQVDLGNRTDGKPSRLPGVAVQDARIDVDRAPPHDDPHPFHALGLL
jgi:hypothetical protein